MITAGLRQNLNPFLRGSLLYSVYWGVVGVFQPFLFIYVSQLGFSSEQIGILSTIYSLCMLVVTPVVSRLADRYNRRSAALALCLAGYGIALAALQEARAFLPMVALFVFMNVFHAPVSPLADSLVVRMAVRHGLNFGGMRLWGSLVFAITSAVFGWVWEQVGFDLTFLVSGGLMVLASSSALLLDESAPDDLSTAPLVPVRRGVPGLTTGFVLLLVSLFLIGATFAMAWTFEGLFVDYLGGTRTLIGGMMGLSALAEIPPMQYGQRIMRRLGDFNSLLLSFLLLGLSYFGYLFAAGAVSILLVNVVKGLGFGLFFIAAVVIVDRHAPPGLASTYQGLMAAVAFGLAPIIAGPLGGWIYGSFAPRTLFLISGLLVIVAMLVLIPAFASESRSRRGL